MLNDRRRSVLSALVDEYVASVQPVGSKVLVQRYGLGCSPATVRSELAALEETGYVFQPHVSAGRIPTDSGYRAYVDDVVRPRVMGLPAPEAERIRRHYETVERELGEVLHETSTLLSRLTSYVAVVVAPTLRRARIRRVTLVPLSLRRALVVVVTDSGQVADRAMEFEADVTREELSAVEAYLSDTLDGAVGAAAESVRERIGQMSGRESAIALRAVDEVLDCLAEADADRVLTGGVSALLAHPEFSDPTMVRPLLVLLEDGLSMLQVLTDVMRTPDVEVRIGHENQSVALGHTSFVAARYGDDAMGGVVGVIGPTRMDYRRAMSAVKTVSDTLSGVLDA
ncbi:MAG TPA: heat-inducible transcription repressor HrcA [Actinobacteria bacterium]|nr:heat-inducible transcription repressor HrcA [Actinomycetota bacterium]